MVNESAPRPSPHNGHAAADGSLSGMKLPLFSLGLLRTTEAIAWTSIFPYVYFMIKSFSEVDESQIPFWAGVLIATFTFCEFLTGTVWAMIGDKIGRRKTLLIGSSCGTLAALWFGVSSSIGMAVASRAFGGLGNPNVGLVQTCVLELVQQEQKRAKALAFVTSLRYSGNLIGPVLGGILADPGTLYPSVFPPNSMLAKHPFLLPNIVVAILQATSWTTAFFFLPESQPMAVKASDPGLRIGQAILRLVGLGGTAPGTTHDYARIHAEEDASDSDSTSETITTDAEQCNEGDDMRINDSDTLPAQIPSLRVFSRQVILQILAVSLLAFHKVAFDAFMPTFLAAPPSTKSTQEHARNLPEPTGGFGYGSQKIGTILLSQAIVALIAQATIVPWLVDWAGPLRAFRIVLGLYPVAYVVTPLIPLLAPTLSLVTVSLDLWATAILSSTGYICSAILIANTTPSPQFLARINGVSASLSCLARSVGPLLVGKLSAVGFDAGYGSRIAFWMLGGMALIGAIESAFLEDHR